MRNNNKKYTFVIILIKKAHADNYVPLHTNNKVEFKLNILQRKKKYKNRTWKI